MNYTDKFHLPQWEKSDRVLMDDFNRMCRDIEAGLAQNAQDTASGIGSAASDNLRLEEKTSQMLRRAAYNHYHLSAAAGTFPRQMGAFRQSMDSLPGNAQGFLQRDGFAWLAGGPKASSTDLFNALVQQSPFQVTSGAALSQCKSLILDFCAPGPMYLNSIKMSSTIRGGNTLVTNVAQYSFRDMTTGEILREGKFVDSLQPNSVGNTNYVFPLQAYLTLGHQYRLQATPLATNFSLELNLADGKTTVEASGFLAQTGSLSYTISESEESRLGLVLVRFTGGEGALSLRWDGVSCPVHAVRSGRWPDGKVYQEAEFLRTGGIPKETQLLLSADCGAGGELALYEWGAILI